MRSRCSKIVRPVHKSDQPTNTLHRQDLVSSFHAVMRVFLLNRRYARTSKAASRLWLESRPSALAELILNLQKNSASATPYSCKSAQDCERSISRLSYGMPDLMATAWSSST